jgi:hypothetical protein
VVARHESLRTVFPADNAGPVPALADPAAYRLVRHHASERDQQAFRADLDLEGNRPFDLEKGPLVRLHVYRRADRDVLLLHIHHIVADAASIVIAAEDMFEAYFALRAGHAPRWQRAVVSPAVFAGRQRELVNGPGAQRHIAFWRQQLDGAPAAIALPTDFPRPVRRRGAGRSRTLEIPRDLAEAIKRLARREGETLYCVLLAAFNVLLHQLGAGPDIVVGTPTHGRSRPELANAVGYLVNAVPIRSRVLADKTFKQLLAETGATVRAALEHQEYPFSSLVRELKVARDPAINPIFQCMFAMERPAEIDSHGFAATLLNVGGAAIQIREFHIESMALNRDRSQFDLTVVVEEHDKKILGVIKSWASSITAPISGSPPPSSASRWNTRPFSAPWRHRLISRSRRCVPKRASAACWSVPCWTTFPTSWMRSTAPRRRAAAMSRSRSGACPGPIVNWPSTFAWWRPRSAPKARGRALWLASAWRARAIFSRLFSASSKSARPISRSIPPIRPGASTGC